jgi:hypothetical protein
VNLTEQISLLDKQFIEKRYQLVEDFLWEKRGFWANLPRLFYISNGKSSAPLQNSALLKNKMYPLDYDFSPLYISCCDLKVYSFYQNIMRFVPIDEKEKTALISELLISGDKEIDGEAHFDYYMLMIQNTKFNQYADDTWKNSRNKKWILNAIADDIPIDYEAYCQHFDNFFVITKPEYDYLYTELSMEYAKSRLLGKAHVFEVFE